jgi:hypothetical protein
MVLAFELRTSCFLDRRSTIEPFCVYVLDIFEIEPRELFAQAD